MSDLIRNGYYDQSLPPDILPTPTPPAAATLTTITPDTIVAGPAGKTLVVVAGTGFTGGSKVYADEAQQITTFVSDTELTYQAEADQAGTQDITVTANAQGASPSNGLVLTVTAAAGTQAARPPRRRNGQPA
jgi:hypothetical protein